MTARRFTPALYIYISMPRAADGVAIRAMALASLLFSPPAASLYLSLLMPLFYCLISRRYGDSMPDASQRHLCDDVYRTATPTSARARPRHYTRGADADARAAYQLLLRFSFSPAIRILMSNIVGAGQPSAIRASWHYRSSHEASLRDAARCGFAMTS